MLLAVDVGNTNIVIGVFDGERLAADFRLHTDDRATGDELGLVITDLIAHEDVSPAAIDAVVVGSVVPALRRSVELLAQRYFGRRPMIVGPGTRTGIRIHYDDPRQVGAAHDGGYVVPMEAVRRAKHLISFGIEFEDGLRHGELEHAPLHPLFAEQGGEVPHPAEHGNDVFW